MNTCIVCNRILKNKILELPNMPMAAQNMPVQNQLINDKEIMLSLYECPGCGVVQFDAPPVSYYRDVIRATRVSEKFRKLRFDQYKRFIDKFELVEKKLLEVGCGGGEFLEILKDFPVQSTGIEHNHNLVALAASKNLNVIEGFIESANDVLPNAPYNAFLVFNFFEHQPNPCGMLQGIYENLTERGVGLLTVPSFEYFQEQASYYEFMRDHIAYYTEESIGRVLQMNGFEIVECNRFNHDTLELFVQKRSKKEYANFIAQKDKLHEEMNQLLQKMSAEKGDIYVWGASHQAFTLLSTLQLNTSIKGIIDSASFKWNKYSPASHIPIISPDILKSVTPKCIIIMAPGFSDEICNQILSINGNITKILSVIDRDIVKLVWRDKI